MKKPIVLTDVATDALTCFALNITEARIARGWTQDEIAKRAQMSRSTYRSIEEGSGSVAFGNYLSVLDILGLADQIRSLAAPHLDEEGRSLRHIKGRHS